MDVDPKYLPDKWTVPEEVKEVKVNSTEPILVGDMRKVNWLYMSQRRTFKLYRDGQIKYYKNEVQHKGTIILASDSRIVKTGRAKFEIIQPTRTWYLEEFAAGTIDNWIAQIKTVVESLQ